MRIPRSACRAVAALVTMVLLTGGAAMPAPVEGGAVIRGTVSSADGGPLTQTVMVSARQGGFDARAVAYADAESGTYEIDGLSPGTYTVVFMPVVADVFQRQYRQQLYDGVYDDASAARIEVTDGSQVFDGVDAVLEYRTERPPEPGASAPCTRARAREAVRAVALTVLRDGDAVARLLRANALAYLARCR